MNIQRGSMVEYVREPGVPVKVISDPFRYNGMDCVVGIRIGSKKNDRQKRYYAVHALRRIGHEEA